MNQQEFEKRQEEKLREVVKNLTEFAGKTMDEEVSPQMAITFLINEIAAHRLLFEEVVANYRLLVEDVGRLHDTVKSMPIRAIKLEWETKDEAEERR